MEQETIAVMHECAVRSHTGIIGFPEVVRKLNEAGVERYHADLCRDSTRRFTCRTASPTWRRVGKLPWAVGEEFSEAGVVAALRAIQRGEILYLEFVRWIVESWMLRLLRPDRREAGKAQYFGRKGEVYVEKFPALSTQ